MAQLLYFSPASYHPNKATTACTQTLSKIHSLLYICIWSQCVAHFSKHCLMKDSFIPLDKGILIIPTLIWHFIPLHGKHLPLVQPSPPPHQGTVGEQSTANLMHYEWSSFGHSVLYFHLLQVAEPILTGNYITRIQLKKSPQLCKTTFQIGLLICYIIGYSSFDCAVIAGMVWCVSHLKTSEFQQRELRVHVLTTFVKSVCLILGSYGLNILMPRDKGKNSKLSEEMFLANCECLCLMNHLHNYQSRLSF